MKMNIMKPKTLIIAGFPGIGKSYAVDVLRSKGLKVSDSDSSSFSWIMKDGEKVRNPNFVRDYMEHIREKVKEVTNRVHIDCVYLNNNRSRKSTKGSEVSSLRLALEVAFFINKEIESIPSVKSKIRDKVANFYVNMHVTHKLGN